MKITPEEIKKGLECCGENDCHHSWQECPYWEEADCSTLLMKDALVCIQQLEAKVEKLEKDVQRGRGEL